MVDNFSARREATKIEAIAAKMADPMYPIERADLQKKLQDEVNSLTNPQMRAVGLLIEKETPRMDAMTGYVNDVTIDDANNVVGFVFNRPQNSVTVRKTN